MPSTILTLLHLSQSAFAAYNLYLAAISITNLQHYEDAAEKVAEYSNIAESQLHKTRTTQASGTFSVLISLISSLTLLIYPPTSTLGKLALAGLDIAVLEAARRHVGGFWKRKAKIPLPGLGKQNEATGKTQEVRLNIAYLIGSWVLAAVGGLVL